MKLNDVYRKDGYLIIDTDEGVRKQSLRWSGVDALEKKCINLKGKKIVHFTYGDWSRDVWFSDIEEVIDKSSIDESNGVADHINLPIGLKFESHKVTKIYGPPGTGKTKALIDIVKKHIANGTKPENIAFVSFTNAAADEAKLRVAEEFPHMGAISFPNFCTLHSLATRVGGALNKVLCQAEHIKQFDKLIRCEFEWIRQGDATSAVDRFKHPIMNQYCLALARCENFKPIATSGAINALATYYNKDEKDIANNFEKYANGYIDNYRNFKREANLVDFNDVIINITFPEFEDRLPTFDLLIIDEAQDLSDLQWGMVRKLISRAKETYVAGDDDQAIMINFGASSHAFLELDGEEKSLPKSFRVPKEVSDYVNKGVMPLLKKIKNRKDKDWLPADHSGNLISLSDKTYKSESGIELHYEYDINELLNEVKRRCNEEWLLLAPTKETGKSISIGLSNLRIPHFYRNRPQAGANSDTMINIRTIHTAKGLGADNVAVIADGMGDIAMLGGDPRLAYVALTRAKKMLYPRVLRKGLLPQMLNLKNGDLPQLAKQYMQMFPEV